MVPAIYPNNLDNQDTLTRASNIIAMGKTRDKRALAPLIKILEDESEVDWLRGCAAIALGRLSAEEAVPLLINAIDDASMTVARGSISALGDIRCKYAIPHLKRILEDETKKELHAITVTALGEIAGRDVISILLGSLENPDNRVRARAAIVLGDLRAGEAVIPFIQLMKDSDECLRAIAASSLGLIGDRRATGTLIEALGDSAESVRAIAASSLGCLGDAIAVNSLEAATGDTSETVRKQAAAAISKIRSIERMEKTRIHR